MHSEFPRADAAALRRPQSFPDFLVHAVEDWLEFLSSPLLKQGWRRDEARADFERAASLTRNTRERTLLRERAAACAR